MDCLFIPIGDFVLDGESTVLNLAEGSLNVPPVLSLITSVFVCTLPALPMGTCTFCLSCPGFLIAGVESISVSIWSIFFYVFSFYGGCFLSFPFLREFDLCLFVACVSFFGMICGFIFCWVVFVIFFIKSLLKFYDIFRCGWLFQQDLQCPLG